MWQARLLGFPSIGAAIGLGVLGAGRGLNALSNRGTRGLFQAVEEAVRRRTPLAAQMPPAQVPATQMTIPEILAATTGPLREEQQPRLDRAGVSAVTDALLQPPTGN